MFVSWVGVIYLLTLFGYYVVTFSKLLYLVWDTHRTCLVGLLRYLLGVLSGVWTFIIIFALSIKLVWLVKTATYVYTGYGLVLWEVFWKLNSSFVPLLCERVCVLCLPCLMISGTWDLTAYIILCVLYYQNSVTNFLKLISMWTCMVERIVIWWGVVDLCEEWWIFVKSGGSWMEIRRPVGNHVLFIFVHI